jgi:hypothetical protein
MKTEIRKISPEIAKNMLLLNPNNRRLSKSHVDFLTKEMINNNWIFDGQPIRFNHSGGLLDGQHRLNAIINSKTTQEFLIVSDIRNDAFKVMDTGRARTAGDVLHIHGGTHSMVLASAIRFILNHKNKQNTRITL